LLVPPAGGRLPLFPFLPGHGIVLDRSALSLAVTISDSIISIKAAIGIGRLVWGAQCVAAGSVEEVKDFDRLEDGLFNAPLASYRPLSQVGSRRKRCPGQFGQDGMGSIPATPSTGTKHASCFPPSSICLPLYSIF
jgi:hypothetical protein